MDYKNMNWGASPYINRGVNYNRNQTSQNAEVEWVDTNDMYPELHKRMMPYINEAISANTTPGADVTEEAIDRMTQHVVSRGNFASNPPPSWHNDRSINDIARALILSSLFGFPFPFFFPRGARFGRRRFRR